MQLVTIYNGMGEAERDIECDVDELQELTDDWSLAKIVLVDGSVMNNQFVKTSEVRQIAAE